MDQLFPQPIAIIGIGCLFPKADGPGSYWANICNRIDTITDIPPTHWRPEDYLDADPKAPDRIYTAKGGFLSPVAFPPLEFGITPNTLEATDTTQLLGLMAARQALEDAGYGPGRAFDRNRVSVLLGVTGTLELVIPLGARLGHPLWRKALKEAGVKDDVAEDVVRRISAGYVGWQEDSFPGLLGNVAAGRIANRLDLGGTNCVIDAACASSLGALHLAMLELASGQADMVVSGGLDTFNDIFMYMCFSKTPALSPTGHAKPFDAKGDGTILGEGLGIVVLKRHADAVRDGDKIYALVRGIGSSSDGKGNAIYAPSPAGQAKALRQAYRLANVTPDTIELVEAHGTGTRAGDAAELTALLEVYRSTSREGTWCALGSVKSQIGHTKAAAGVAGLIKATLALYHKVLPPTIKVTEPLEQAAPGRGPFYINTEKRPWLPAAEHPRRAAVSSFGFGGSNFHCVLEEYGSQKPAIDWDGNVQILAFAADTRAQIQSALAAWPANLSWEELRAEAARGRRDFQGTRACRLALVIEKDKTDVSLILANARTLLDQQRPQPCWNTPEKIYFGSGVPPGTLGMLFPGQGSQYAGMLRDLACHFPEVQEVLAEADQVNGGKAGQRLSDFIYPHPVFRAEDRQRNEEALRATDIAQPALGAVSLGTLRVLERFGVQPAAVAGHSYGELVALCAAGWIDAPSLHTLSRARGRLMASASLAQHSRNHISPSPPASGGAPRATGWGEGGRSPTPEQDSLCEDLILSPPSPSPMVLHRSGGEGSNSLRPAKNLGDSITGDRGAMLAVQATQIEVETLLREETLDLVLANKNAPRQFVLSGSSATVARAAEACARRNISCRTLPVAAAFHSPFVAEVQKPFLESLEQMPFQPGSLPVFANSTARQYPHNPHEARVLLAEQLAQPVEFIEEIANMYQFGVRTFVEVGPGNKLAGLAGAILDGKESATVIAVDASSGKRSGFFDLACTLAHLATLGHDVRLSRWDTPPDRAAARLVNKKPTLTVPICGANYVRPRDSREPSAESQEPNKPTDVRLLALDSRLSTHKSHESGVRNSRELSAESQEPNKPADVRLLALDSRLSTHKSQGASISNQKSETSVKDSALSQALRLTQENLLALQKLGEQTAQLQRQFLEGQDQVLHAFQTLLGQQQQLVQASLGMAPAPVTVPFAPPVIANLAENKAPSPSSVAAAEAPLVAARFQRAPDVPAPSPVAAAEAPLVAARFQRAPDVPVPPPVVISAAPTSPAVPPVPVPALAASTVANGHVETTLLAVVSEKTGYPPEMLELDMELDADMGIDSIKRVEIFSAIQERLPEAPVVKPEHLGTLRTLRHVVNFLSDASAASPVHHSPLTTHHSPLTPHPSPLTPHQIHDGRETAQILLAVVSEKTGYPPEMLELDMELDSDLGIDSIKRVEIFSTLQERLPEAPVVKPEHLGALRSLRHVVEFLAAAETANARNPVPTGNRVSDSTSPSLLAEAGLTRYVLERVDLDENAARAGIALAEGSEIWITEDGSPLAANLAGRLNSLGYRPRLISWNDWRTLPRPDTLSGLVILAPLHEMGDAFLKEAFQLLQLSGPGLRQAGQNDAAVFATISRLDGAFGLEKLEGDPASGGLAGLAKTAGHEWSEVCCKALDLDAAFDDSEEAALAIVDEMLRRGPAEVGIGQRGRSTLRLVETALEVVSGSASPLSAGDVVVVAGGARGVTAAAAVALAGAFAPTLVLLGRTPEPGPEPAWLTPWTEEGDLKRVLLEHANGKASPREIGEQYRLVSANRSIRHTLERIRSTGAKVLYRAVDVRDAEAVRAIFAQVRAEVGPIRGIVHGAGVLADRRIEDKTEEQFDRVYQTKVLGLRSLLQAVAEDALKILVLFSSSTARFGRAGQVDYALANEVLNKTAQREARRRPGCKVVSINWGPWEGGMVTPLLQKIFEKEGVGLIPLAAGAGFLVRELQTPARGPVEVVVLGAHAGLDSWRRKEPEREEITPQSSVPGEPECHAARQAPARADALALAFERELDVEHYPVLRAHVLDGRAVLPMALILEWLAHGALHGNPGLAFHGCDDLRVLKGVRLEEDRPRPIRVLAGKAVKQDALFRVPVEMRGLDQDGRESLHARADILLAGKLPQGERRLQEAVLPPYRHDMSEIYESLLFHGPELQGIERVEGVSAGGIAGLASAAPLPADWIRQPLRTSWLADPLVLDCAFQLMILWSIENHKAGSLPCHAGRYRQYRRSFPRDGARILIEITKNNRQRALANIDFLDRSGGLIACMEDYECVIDASLAEAFRRNQLLGCSGD